MKKISKNHMKKIHKETLKTNHLEFSLTNICLTRIYFYNPKSFPTENQSYNQTNVYR